MTDLKVLFKECGYQAGLEDEMIRDHIVFGVKSTKVREKLINEGNALTLEKCMDIARTYELSQKQLKTMNSGEDANVYSVKQKNPKKKRPSIQGKSKFGQKKQGGKSKFDIPKGEKKKIKCEKCGYDHTDSKQCPAQGKECSFVTKRTILLKCVCLEKASTKGNQRVLIGWMIMDIPAVMKLMMTGFMMMNYMCLCYLMKWKLTKYLMSG